jgi:DNA-binding HxlR family transcriptional regulator
VRGLLYGMNKSRAAEKRGPRTKHKYLRGDLLDQNCPTRLVLDSIGDMWTSMVVYLLARNGPMRFNVLARCATGISAKVLTQTLRRLERDGLVTRSVEPTRPPAVTYALTPLGATLSPVLEGIRQWAETNVPAILTHRASYEAADS